MSTNTDETENIINEKKKKKQPKIDNITNSYIDLLKNAGITVVVILAWCILGGIVLYGCKISQSNILPTEIGCKPYTTNPVKIQEIITDIFSSVNSNGELLSMKLKIPNNDMNKNYYLFNSFCNMKNDKKTGVITNYFISIFEELLRFNFAYYNTAYNFLNTYWNETSVVLLGPLLLVFVLFPLSILLNTVNLFYLWISKMSWFFKVISDKNNNSETIEETIIGENENLNKTTVVPECKDNNIKWENIKFTSSPMSYCISWVMVCVFLWLSVFSQMLTPITMTISALGMLTIKGEYVLKDNETKAVTQATIIKDLILHYRKAISIIFSILTVFYSYTAGGTTMFLSTITVICLIFYGLINIPLFKTIVEDNLSAGNKIYKQATKKCVVASEKIDKRTIIEKIKDNINILFDEIKESGSSIYSHLPFYHFFEKSPKVSAVKQQLGGGDLIKEIKKISKTLSKRH